MLSKDLVCSHDNSSLLDNYKFNLPSFDISLYSANFSFPISVISCPSPRRVCIIALNLIPIPLFNASNGVSVLPLFNQFSTLCFCVTFISFYFPIFYFGSWFIRIYLPCFQYTYKTIIIPQYTLQ